MTILPFFRKCATWASISGFPSETYSKKQSIMKAGASRFVASHFASEYDDCQSVEDHDVSKYYGEMRNCSGEIPGERLLSCFNAMIKR